VCPWPIVEKKREDKKVGKSKTEGWGEREVRKELKR
jgi:hypothetical protein